MTATALDHLEKKLLRTMGKLNEDFGLIEDGDRIMVCVSGGKDSYGMLHLLRAMQRKAPIAFSLVAVNLDQGHPGFPGHVLEGWLKDQGFEHHMLTRDTYSIVKEKVPEGKTTCSLCSRLRRGILYDAAQDLGCTKLALGHHRDDVLETLLLNLFYAGQMKAMPPKLTSDDGRNVVIRPLATCAESDLAQLAALLAFPILPCDLCGSQENLQRKRIKQLLSTLESDIPFLKSSMMAALANVRPTHLFDPAVTRDTEPALTLADLERELSVR